MRRQESFVGIALHVLEDHPLPFVEIIMHQLNNSWDVIRTNGFEIVNDIFSWSFEMVSSP